MEKEMKTRIIITQQEIKHSSQSPSLSDSKVIIILISSLLIPYISSHFYYICMCP